jgi:dolichol-phosphate mannosyltransferase
MTVWIVLPAYNEAEGLPHLLEAIARTGEGRDWRTIVVDDGSTDGTGDVARGFAGRLSLTVLTHPENRGLAAAIRTGLEHVCREAAPGDALITMDADNTHSPEQIPQMVQALDDGADVVIASRYVHGARQAGVPAHRALLSAGVGRMLRVRFGLPGVRDYSCGYRAYRVALLQRAAAAYGPRLIESRGFVVMTELLVKLAHYRPRIVEVPLDLRYDRKAGESKMPAGRTIAGYLRLMLARAARPGPGRAP